MLDVVYELPWSEHAVMILGMWRKDWKPRPVFSSILLLVLLRAQGKSSAELRKTEFHDVVFIIIIINTLFKNCSSLKLTLTTTQTAFSPQT